MLSHQCTLLDPCIFQSYGTAQYQIPIALKISRTYFKGLGQFRAYQKDRTLRRIRQEKYFLSLFYQLNNFIETLKCTLSKKTNRFFENTRQT